MLYAASKWTAAAFRTHGAQALSACDLSKVCLFAADCSQYSACQKLDHPRHFLGSASASSAPCLQANPGRVSTMAV